MGIDIHNMERATGFVLPVGNGGVGKTSLARVLLEFDQDQEGYEDLIETRVTKNLEFEFVPLSWKQGDQNYRVMAQPGDGPGPGSPGAEAAGKAGERPHV